MAEGFFEKAYSPNLSSEVLDKAAKRGILTDTMKYEVMKANAEGVTAEIITYLATRANLPQWMIDSIETARNTLTLRSYLLDTLTYHAEQRAFSNYSILQLIQEDTAGFNLNNYRSWLDSADGLWARREKINTYLHENKFDTAIALTAQYDTTEIHNPSDSAAFKNYSDYVTAYANMLQADSSVMRMDSTHRETLRQIADADEHKKGSNAARNLLNFFYDSTYFTPAMLPSVEFGKKGNNDETIAPIVKQKEQPKETASIKLYPNPAKDAVTIEYSGLAEGSRLYVSDAMGLLYETRVLNGENGKVEINTSGYTSGIYLARVETEGDAPLKNKFIILR